MWHGLCNRTVSERLCPIYWPLQAAAVGLLVWSLFVWTIIWPQQRRAASLLLSAAWAGDIDQQRREPSSRCGQCHGDSQVTNVVKSTLDSNTDSTLSLCSVMEKEITEHVGLRVTSKRISVFVQRKFSIEYQFATNLQTAKSSTHCLEVSETEQKSGANLFCSLFISAVTFAQHSLNHSKLLQWLETFQTVS